MTPHRPLGTSRPLVPVIGGGGGRLRRRGSLSLLWRRLRPVPAGPPPRTRVRPLHFHPRWTFDIKLYWSVLAAPVGWRSHDLAAPPAPRGRGRGADGESVMRSALRSGGQRGGRAQAAAPAGELAPRWRLRPVAARPVAPGGATAPAGSTSARAGSASEAAPVRRRRPDARLDEARLNRLRADGYPVRTDARPRALAPGPVSFRSAPAPARAAALRPAAPVSPAFPTNRADSLARLVAAARVPPAERLPALFRPAPPPTRRRRAAPVVEPGTASGAAPGRRARRTGQAPSPRLAAATFAALVATAGAARRRWLPFDVRRAIDPPSTRAPSPVRRGGAAASPPALPRQGRVAPAPAMAHLLRPSRASTIDAGPAWREGPRSAAAPARPIGGSRIARHRPPLGRSIRGVRGLTAAEACATAAHGAPTPPSLRRAALHFRYGRIPGPGEAELRVSRLRSPKRRPRPALAVAPRPPEQESTASAARILGQARRARKAGRGDRTYRAPPTIDRPIGQATGPVQRVSRTRAPIAPAVRARTAPAVPMAAAAPAPRRRSGRHLPPAFRLDEAPPSPAIPLRPPRRSVMRAAAPPPPANPEPGAPVATMRRRQTPASQAARRPRGADATSVFGPTMTARRRRPAIGPAPAPRSIVESIIMPGLPLRRQRELRGLTRLEALVTKAAPAPPRGRRGTTRPAALPTSPARRRVRRDSPAPPILIERTVSAAPVRSLRLVHARAAAAEAGRPARRSAELLWANPRSSPSAAVMETGANRQAAAAEPASAFAAQESPPGPFPQPPPPDMNRLVDEVMDRLGRQARTERLRRGL